MLGVLTAPVVSGKVWRANYCQVRGKLAILATTATGGRCEAPKIIEPGDPSSPAGLSLECPFPTNRESTFLLDFRL
jgi:hypothetical protein